MNGDSRMRNLGPLLLDGYGLQREDGSLALCIGVDSVPEGNHKYRMFEDGEFSILTGDALDDELSAGSRIIIVQI